MTRESILLILFFCFSVIGGTGSLWIKNEIDFTNWWMVWNAAGYPVLFSAIRLLAKDFYTQLFSSALLILSIGEFVDELGYGILPEIFNPTIESWNEYIFFGLTTLYVIWRCTRKRN